MRKLQDINGIEIYVECLNWRSTFHGWMEGDPEYMTEAILNGLEPGIIDEFGPYLPRLIVNSEERRTRAEVFGGGSSGQQEKKYLPAEMAVAFLTSNWTPKAEDEDSRLVIAWFQDPSDPFATLEEIVAKIDWKDHAAGWAL